jgi:hypothetical protein
VAAHHLGGYFTIQSSILGVILLLVGGPARSGRSAVAARAGCEQECVSMTTGLVVVFALVTAAGDPSGRWRGGDDTVLVSR